MLLPLSQTKKCVKCGIQKILIIKNGEAAIAQNFGEIKYYDLSDCERWACSFNLKLIDHLGIRTFFGLHPDNSIRYNENWIQSMFELEQRVSRIKEFRNIAFYNHLILEKQGEIYF